MAFIPYRFAQFGPERSVPRVTTQILVRFPKDILPKVVISVFLNGQHARVLHGIYYW
jgi:hypothetical protein